MTPSRPDLARTLAPAAEPLTPLPAWATPEFWADAAVEGVLPLIVATVSDAGWEGVPGDVRARALEGAREEAARAELSHRDLRRVLAAFNERSLPALLIKGAALGYTHYGGLQNRPRLDVDLLIREEDVARAHAVFRALEAEYVPHVSGLYVMSQFHYRTTDRAGCRHAYDVHWRLVNGRRFAAALSFDELFPAATTPAALAAVRARTPSPAHALLLACLHRAAHHAGQGPLIWLYDMHLVAGRLADGERQIFLALALERRLGAIAAHALGEAAATLGGSATAALAADLRALGADQRAADRYLSTRGSRARALLDDLAVLEGWHSRLGLVREVLFPPATYMRAGYAPGSTAPLALLYWRRATRGAVAFLRRR